ncbi:MAG: DUF1501 domain-containing protein [Bryobacterales bacterium]|nr:DUF1501 domain-containing protein [Bryobacterales bacterium]
MAIRSRRESLAASGSVAAASAFARFGMMNANAQQAGDYKALVCVFLFGGNDGHNTVAPRDTVHAEYATLRGSLAIPQADLLSVPAKNGKEFGLHPNLGFIHPYFAQGKLAVVANVGVLYRPITRDQYRNKLGPIPSNLFSHSDQQQQWQTGYFDYSRGTGWGGRTADLVAHLNAPSKFPTAVSLAGNQIMLAGKDTTPAAIAPGGGMQLTGNGGVAFREARQKALQEMIGMDSGLAMVQAAGQTLQDGLDVGKLINEAIATAPPLQTAFPNTNLGRQLLEVARLIASREKLGMRRQIFFASIGGFDTHANQLATHANLMSQLAEAMNAFYLATEELSVANSVVTFTESEFGRTMNPAAGAGTDHAWGSHHLLLGASVKGGDIFGAYPNLALGGPDDSGSRGSYIPTTSLDQYGATLASWFGVSPSALDDIFPNLIHFSNRTLDFV